MAELAEIAASVAKALGLRSLNDHEWITPERGLLRKDGSDVFAIYWQIRCRDWLLRRGDIRFVEHGVHEFYSTYSKEQQIVIECPRRRVLRSGYTRTGDEGMTFSADYGCNFPKCPAEERADRLEQALEVAREALHKLLTEVTAIHGDDAADARTLEQARAALKQIEEIRP